MSEHPADKALLQWNNSHPGMWQEYNRDVARAMWDAAKADVDDELSELRMKSEIEVNLTKAVARHRDELKARLEKIVNILECEPDCGNGSDGCLVCKIISVAKGDS